MTFTDWGGQVAGSRLSVWAWGGLQAAACKFRAGMYVSQSRVHKDTCWSSGHEFAGAQLDLPAGTLRQWPIAHYLVVEP